MKTLNVGIIGCGNISGIYLQNIPAFRGLTLRACADMRPEIAQAQASRYGIEALSVEQLLAAAEAMPESAWSRTCTIGDSGPLTLKFVVDDYVAHMMHHLRHIGIEVDHLVSV